MHFESRTTEALEQGQIEEELTQGLDLVYDLGILFVCPFSPYNPQEIYSHLRHKLKVNHLLLCTCAGIIGTDREIEGKPSASLFVTQLPDVRVDLFHIKQADIESLKKPDDWYQFLEVFPNEKPNFIILADPYSISMNNLLAGMSQAYEGAAVIGGLASAGIGPNENILIMNDEIFSNGAIGVCLTGNIKVETVVSQGCRPIGKTYVITKAERNIIHELSGEPFTKILEGVLKRGTDYDRDLANEAVFIGIAMNEYHDEFKRGDFLVRAVMAIYGKTGAGAVGDLVKVGQTVQFHLRDAHTATEDLHELLKTHRENHPNDTPEGVLVFNCYGRGINLFKKPNFDIGIIQHHLKNVPATGFFCAGEFGPVAGINYLHGFTNSMAIFYPKK